MSDPTEDTVDLSDIPYVTGKVGRDCSKCGQFIETIATGYIECADCVVKQRAIYPAERAVLAAAKAWVPVRFGDVQTACKASDALVDAVTALEKVESNHG